MALLRSVGATPRPVRRLVIGEVAVVAMVAALLGTFGGIPVARWLAGVFAGFDELPDGFAYRSNWIPVLVSIVATWGVAVLSASGAARAAGRASPAEAMTGSVAGQQRLGVVRWVVGVVFVAGAIALVVVAATVNDDPGLAIGYVFMSSACALIGVASLGQVAVVPWRDWSACRSG